MIIALTIVGVIISSDSNKLDFPPRIDSCPDYWVHASYLKDPNNVTHISSDDIDVKALNEECINIKNLGSCNPQDQIMDFNVAPYSNEEAVVQQVVCVQNTNGLNLCNITGWYIKSMICIMNNLFYV